MRGRWAWPALAASVLTIDAWLIVRDCNTLSGQFSNAAKHPTWRWAVAAAAIYINAHLWERVPEHLDPLSRVSNQIRSRYR